MHQDRLVFDGKLREGGEPCGSLRNGFGELIGPVTLLDVDGSMTWSYPASRPRRGLPANRCRHEEQAAAPLLLRCSWTTAPAACWSRRKWPSAGSRRGRAKNQRTQREREEVTREPCNRYAVPMNYTALTEIRNAIVHPNSVKDVVRGPAVITFVAVHDNTTPKEKVPTMSGWSVTMHDSSSPRLRVVLFAGDVVEKRYPPTDDRAGRVEQTIRDHSSFSGDVFVDKGWAVEVHTNAGATVFMTYRTLPNTPADGGPTD